jgi:glycosyltransferase involved in cell wall biosynthesis
VKILVLNWLDSENPQAGGAEVHLHEIFRRLVAWGHSVTLLCSAWPGSARHTTRDGIDVHRVGSRYTLSLAAPVYFRRRLRAERFDVVVEDLNKVPFFSPFWGVGAPVTLIVHHLFGTAAFQEASLPVAAATWLLELPLPRVFRSVPTVAVSESTAADLVQRGMPRGGIEIIPNGVDLEILSPSAPEGRFPDPTLLYLGRLKRYKRVDLLLRAVAALVERGTPCRLLIAGRGDDQPRLEALRESLGLQQHVEFLGFVSEEEKRELLRKSWINLLTSVKEGWGISNLEAAACGTPTIASDVPGLRDSVVDGQTGFLVPHGDVEVLSRRIKELLEDEEERTRMGIGARRFAERFSWDASARAMEKFLQERVVDAPPQS